MRFIELSGDQLTAGEDEGGGGGTPLWMGYLVSPTVTGVWKTAVHIWALRFPPYPPNFPSFQAE